MTEPSDLLTTRTFYDTIAADYAEMFKSDLDDKPLDQAMLRAFADLVRQGEAAGPVADLGCGPGRATAYLHGLGLDVFGVDLSPGMLAVARQENPELRFDEGPMTGLDLPDGALGGIVAYYSLIHTPAERLPAVLAEFSTGCWPRAAICWSPSRSATNRCAWPSRSAIPCRSTSAGCRPTRSPDCSTGPGSPYGPWQAREPEGREKVPQACLLARKPEARPEAA